MTSGPRVRVGLGWVWGLGFGVQGLNGLGFSEQVTALTHLSCPGFSYGWGGACHTEQRQDKRRDKRVMSTEEMVFMAMLFDN